MFQSMISTWQPAIQVGGRQGFPGAFVASNTGRARFGDCRHADHEVSLIAGELPSATASTRTMRPRWQTGHSRNEIPVSSSC